MLKSTGAGALGAPSAARPLTRLQLLVFGFPALPHAFVALPLNIVIPAYYASHTNVTLLQIGAFTSASRLADAVLDPLVGLVSDRSRSRWGKRKPFTLMAGLVCSLALFFLFQPPAGATILYYGAWSFALYFGFSLFEIPRSAWSAEINREYKERARINTAVAQFNVVGSLVFWVIPIVLYKISGTTAITGQTLSMIAWLYMAIMIPGLVIAAKVVPGGEQTVVEPMRLVDLFRSALGNRPLQSYLVAYGLWGLGQGAALSCTMLFLSDRMGLAKAFPFLMIALFGATILSIPAWAAVAARVGRHRAWAFSLALSAVSKPAVLLFAPGSASLGPMLALTCLSGVLTAPWNFAPPAMLSDVIDYDLWKSRSNKAGAIFALNTLLVKGSMALGAGAAFVVLDVFRYHPGMRNVGSGDTGLLIGYLAIPGALHLLSALAGWSFPMNARRQATVRRSLERRVVRPA